MSTMIWQALMLSGLLYVASFNAAISKAAIFTDLSFEQAKQEAENQEKMLLIDFSASWCAPCKKMEKTTWSDPAVQSWIRQNAIAIQVDVDQDSRTTNRFKIKGMPTVVLFTPKSGKEEFGRQDGLLSASELLQWLEGAKSGKTAAELEKSARSGNEAFEHLEKYRNQLAKGNNDEALAELVWLWENSKVGDGHLGNIRESYLPFEMKKLSESYPAAKVRFAQMQEQAVKANDLKDFFLLNSVIGQENKTLEWFEKAKDDPVQKQLIREHASSLAPILFSKRMFTDAAIYLYPEPLARVQELYQKAESMRKPTADTEFSKDFNPFPNLVMMLYGAYVGAGKDSEAKQIYDECLRLDQSPAMKTVLNNMGEAMKKSRELK